MTEILFYHLEARALEAVLPTLLEKTLERGWRAIVEAGDADRLARLDDLLWTYRDDSFLPHGLAGGADDARQPILLAREAGANVNGAHVRFYVERAVPGGDLDYGRIVYLFSGHDPDAVAEARAAWRALREGNDVTYWQQDAAGRWGKMA